MHTIRKTRSSLVVVAVVALLSGCCKSFLGTNMKSALADVAVMLLIEFEFG